MPVDCAVDGFDMVVKNASGSMIPCKSETMPFYYKEKKIRTVKG
jgi:aminomethyltransferase